MCNQIQENDCKHNHMQQGTSMHKRNNRSAHRPFRARPFHTDKNWSFTILLNFPIWYQAQAELSLGRHFLELLHLYLTASTTILSCGFILCLDIMVNLGKKCQTILISQRGDPILGINVSCSYSFLSNKKTLALGIYWRAASIAQSVCQNCTDSLYFISHHLGNTGN